MSSDAPAGRELYRDLALAGIAALLLWLAYPPMGWAPLAFLALAPLAGALARLGSDPSAGSRAARLGLLFGLMHYGLVLHWAVVALAPQGVAGAAVALAAIGALSAIAGITTWAAWRAAAGRASRLALTLPLAWTAMEWGLEHAGTIAYPWLGLGVALASFPSWAGSAEWVGEFGLALWVGAVGSGVGVLVALPTTRGVRSLVACLALAILPLVAGTLRTRSLPTVPGPLVLAVRTDVPARVKAVPEEAVEATLRQLERALFRARERATEPWDLVVLPETALPVQLEDRPDLVQRLVEAVGDAPLLVGALGNVARGRRSNTVFLVDGSGIVGRYDKRWLIPFVEGAVPGAAHADAFQAGEGPVGLRFGGLSAGVLICFESAFLASARDLRRAGSDLLVAVSSDAWFEGPGTRTAARQQIPHLALRAIETRMPVVRAGNGGSTRILTPTGHTVAEARDGGGEVALARLRLSPTRTLFVRTGDWVGPLSAVLLVGLLLRSLRPPGRRG